MKKSVTWIIFVEEVHLIAAPCHDTFTSLRCPRVHKLCNQNVPASDLFDILNSWNIIILIPMYFELWHNWMPITLAIKFRNMKIASVQCATNLGINIKTYCIFIELLTDIFDRHIYFNKLFIKYDIWHWTVFWKFTSCTLYIAGRKGNELSLIRTTDTY